MTKYTIVLDSKIYKYILGISDGSRLPLLIKEDPVIQYVRDEILYHYYCPFCGRYFGNPHSIRSHLASSKKCKAKLNDLIQYTIDRYLLIASRSDRVTRFMHKVYEPQYI